MGVSGRKARRSPGTAKGSSQPVPRVVRMVVEHRAEHASQRTTIRSIAAKIGCSGETQRHWVHQAERNRDNRGGMTTKMRDRLKALERESRELRQANEILRKASAYFAQAESCVIANTKNAVEDRLDKAYPCSVLIPPVAQVAARTGNRLRGLVVRRLDVQGGCGVVMTSFPIAQNPGAVKTAARPAADKPEGLGLPNHRSSLIKDSAGVKKSVLVREPKNAANLLLGSCWKNHVTSHCDRRWWADRRLSRQGPA